jgi:hypothetical protein
MDNITKKFKHTLDAPNDVVDKKLQALLKELGITDEDIEAIDDDDI